MSTTGMSEMTGMKRTIPPTPALERKKRQMRQSRVKMLFAGLAGFLMGFAGVLAVGMLNSAQSEAASRSKGLSEMAARGAYRQFVDDFWHRARRAGIRRATYKRAFAVKGAMLPDMEVLERQAWQPEFRTPPAEYLRKRLSEKRINTGVEKLRKHARLLRGLQRKYGVDKHILLAIWGLESNYGQHMGMHYVVRALATMASAGKRRQRRYARTQLIAALKILQSGDIAPAQMRGSWAGAMGHTQFIPTTYLGYAVDITGDKRRDIWNSVSDALGSTANYLKKRGWRRGLPWGWKVRVSGKARHMIGRRYARSIRAWEKLGVRPAGKSFYARKAKAWLVKLRGDGQYYLVTRNFRSLLAYNNAKTYALSVGLLADAIAQAASRKPAAVARTRQKATVTPDTKERLRMLIEEAAQATASVD